MKQITLILTSALSLFFASCNNQTASKIFYQENNYNTTKEIKSFDNKLFILGQHFTKEDTIQHTTTILCLDTSLKKLWDKHFGNVHSKERFESFSIGKDGNIYVGGYNENLKSALLLKINQKGEMIWRKKFNSINSFNNVEVYNDSFIIVAGTKHFSDAELIKDTSVIQKMDLNGTPVWTKSICLDNGIRFLKLANDKIMFCTNGIYNSTYLNSKLFCLNQNGEIEWEYNLDLANTAIDNGVKAINLKIDNNKEIYVLCQSHNMYNTAMTLFKFDLLGRKINTYKIDLANLPDKKNNKDRPFLVTGLNVSVFNKEPYQIIIRKDKQNNPFFSSTSANNQLIDFTELNNKIFTIANTGELDKHLSEWQISKLDE